jgi:Lar family restriction alleviation protein
MTEVELKPCPFCGGGMQVASVTHGDDDWDDYYVSFCRICESHGPKSDFEDEAIELSNRRVVTRLGEDRDG